MSYKNKRFVLAYCFLVILPILGFMEVLKKGRGMSAPPSVDGTWKVEANAIKLATLLCGKSTPAIQESFVTISQSGKNLALELNSEPAASGVGVIEGSIIKASLLPLPKGPNQTACVSGRLLTLNATVDARVGLRLLAGELSLDACSSCMTIDFHAARQVAPASKGVH
jgi:hypothetical protein